jgi:hypothetical protein
VAGSEGPLIGGGAEGVTLRANLSVYSKCFNSSKLT